MKTAADGDDYTWQARGGAVLNGDGKPSPAAGFAELRANFGEEADRIWPNGITVDLRTPDQREREDVAGLNLRCDNLVDALAALTWRVEALEQAAVATKG